METWSITDPERGEICIYVGPRSELAQLDPDWPDEKKEPAKSEDDQPVTAQSEVVEYADLETDDPPRARRLAEVFTGISERSEHGILVSRAGEAIARRRSVGPLTVSLDATIDKGKISPSNSCATGDRLQIIGSSLTNSVHDIYLRRTVDGKKEIDALAAPSGSRAHKRQAEMAESPWKRLAYPLVGGIGKGGWALVVIIFGPVVGKFFGWLFGLLEPYLPDIKLPTVNLPSIPWPDWKLPSIPWPDWQLPDFSLPAWLEPVMEYSKVWVPVLIGIVLGIVAIRTQRKARRHTEAKDDPPSAAEAASD